MSYNNSKTTLVRWTGNDDNDSARPTRPAVIRRNGAAMAGQFRVNGAPPARSTRPGRVLAPFFGRSPIPNRRQPGLSRHDQSDMPMPATPVADLGLIQARLAFGRFETLFNGCSCRRDLGQPFQAHVWGCVGQEVGQVGSVRERRTIN
jgi:hypothetical protein